MNESPPEQNTVARDALLYGVSLLLAALASYFLWAFSHVISGYAAYSLGGRPLPQITSFFLDNRILLLLFPAPWLIFAIYSSVRGPRPAHTLVLYSATLTLGLVALCVVVAIAFVLPWIFIPGGH
jgi:hypothetical protein